ncbi:MAG: hypothetical protein WKF70_13950 [Chitinophagaceae bacterium]
MKIAATVLADAPTTSLQLAYSYLVPVRETFRDMAPAKTVVPAKPPAFKSLFIVDPATTRANSWSVEWFNNYE